MPTESKRLYRHPDEGVIAGVCAGIADYLDVDVTLVRVLFVIFALAEGIGLLVYIVLAIVAPTAGTKPESHETRSERGENLQQTAENTRKNVTRNNFRNYAGFGIIAVGIWLFIGEIYPGWLQINWSYIWPLALIAIGILIVVKPTNKE